MKLKKIIIIFIFLLSYSHITSQYVRFTPEPEKFLKEVQSFLGNVDKSYAKNYVKTFEPLWLGSFFTPDIKAHIYATLNTMGEKRFSPNIEYVSYFNAILSFAQSGLNEEKFDQWQSALDRVLNIKQKKRTKDFLKFSEYFFKDNSIYVASLTPGSTVWKTSNRDFTISYEKEPIFHFSNIDLKCFSKNDSSVIYHTSGDFYPLKAIWIGKGGKIDWQRAKLDKDQVYAEIKNYNITLKSTSFNSDSALFYSNYFNDPVLGKLSEKVISNLGYKKVRYPSFESYDKRLLIKDVFPNVDYDGGFTIRGRNLIGAGSIDNLARLIFNYQDKGFLYAESINFIINDEEISSERAKVKFFIEQDSITHPAVTFKYAKSIKTLTLTRGDDGISAAPFYNSYHRLDMYPQSMIWKLGDPIINFEPLPLASDNRAQFASLNFFDQRIFDDLTGNTGNPLVKIKNFTIEYGGTEFPVTALANYFRKTVQDIQFLLFKLTEYGFINYDDDRKLVSCSEKLFNYIENRAGKQDYDVLIISSNAKNNASLSLSSYDLNINGIDRVLLSSANKVWIKPVGNQIRVKKNRDMNFDGLITAGKTQYFGNGFSFLYDEFKLNMTQCDSMLIWADYKEGKRKGQLVQSPSILESLVGYIEIDDSLNKSGIDTSMHDYPKFFSNTKSFVYYDDPSIQGGLYSRDTFMFIIEPFMMDSLDNFENEGLSLNGLFKSGGIFPDFEEKLSIQKDYSLGFIRETPEDGYRIYSQVASYDDQIRLSNEGLKGSGSIEFYTSTAMSDDITFYPDSVGAIAHSYENVKQEKDPQIPKVVGKDCRISYLPNDKILKAQSIEEHFVFFDDDDADLIGELTLDFEGIKGNGIMRFGKGEVQSYEYTYETDAILADTAEFRLVSEDQSLDELSFKTQNLNARVDFTKRIGEFKSNSGEAFVTFPENQYICYMDQFNWYMDNDDLEMQNSKQASADINIDTDLDLAVSNFYSIHPDQDSLNFGSPKARFDVKRKKITCTKIPFVKIADTRIVPDSGNIVIRRKARMETLKNAVLYTNDVSKYYKIYDAEIEVNTRHDYIASGTYDYVDENEQVQNIYFSKLQPDTTDQTFGIATIDQDKNFKLGPKYDFYGEVHLASTNPNLEFSGVTKINHSCKNIPQEWVEFTANIDPNNILIPVVKDTVSKEDDPDRIFSGMVFNTTDSVSLYGSFLGKKSNSSHLSMLNATGYLTYNNQRKEYQLSNKDKLTEYKLPGTYASINTESCRIKADGPFEIGVELDQLVLEPAGEIKFNPKNWSTDLKTSTIIRFPFSEQALDKLSKTILEFPDLRILDASNSYYEKALRELVGIDMADKMVSELTINGKIKKYPEKLEAPFYFGDVRFRWDPNKKAYVSYGDLGIANINKRQVMKYVKGKIVVSKRMTGNDITIYLQLDDKNYYYFNYKRGLMQVYSSNEEFNTIISETKKDETKFKGVKDQEDFQFMLGTQKLVAPFKTSYMD